MISVLSKPGPVVPLQAQAVHSTCPPDKLVPVNGRHSCNVVNRLNKTSTEYSPVGRKAVSQQSCLLEGGECSPEFVSRAQEPVPLEVPVPPRAEPATPTQAQPFHSTQPACPPDGEFSFSSMIDSARRKPETMVKKSHGPWLIDNIAACVRARLAA